MTPNTSHRAARSISSCAVGSDRRRQPFRGVPAPAVVRPPSGYTVPFPRRIFSAAKQRVLAGWGNVETVELRPSAPSAISMFVHFTGDNLRCGAVLALGDPLGVITSVPQCGCVPAAAGANRCSARGGSGRTHAEIVAGGADRTGVGIHRGEGLASGYLVGLSLARRLNPPQVRPARRSGSRAGGRHPAVHRSGHVAAAVL